MKFQNNQPIYIQIANHIKEQIASGQLQAGDKLSSIREYSVFFEVSALTMQRAMEYLIKENLVVSKRGIGNFINEESANHLQEELVSKQTHNYLQTMKNCGLSSQEIIELVKEILEEDTL